MNWEAIAAVGQCAGALATFLSLWFLWSQIKLTKEDLQQQTRQLELAVQQMTEANQRAEQERQEAVRPDVVLERAWRQSEATIHHFPKKTLILRNLGLGPARQVSLWHDNPDDELRSFVCQVADLLPEQHDVIDIPKLSLAKGNLVLEYFSLYGGRFEKRWLIGDEDGELVFVGTNGAEIPWAPENYRG